MIFPVLTLGVLDASANDRKWVPSPSPVFPVAAAGRCGDRRVISLVTFCWTEDRLFSGRTLSTEHGLKSHQRWLNTLYGPLHSQQQDVKDTTHARQPACFQTSESSCFTPDRGGKVIGLNADLVSVLPGCARLAISMIKMFFWQTLFHWNPGIRK